MGKLYNLIEEVGLEMWRNGGSLSLVQMHPDTLKDLSQEFGTITRSTTIWEDGRLKVVPDSHPSLRGGLEIVRLEYPWGGVDVKARPDCPPDSIYLFTRHDTGWASFGQEDIIAIDDD